MAASRAVRHELVLPLNGQVRRRGYVSPQRRTQQHMHFSRMSSRERAGYQSVTASAKPDQEAPSSSTSSLSRAEGADLQPGPGLQQQAQGGWTILGLEPSAELAAISIGAVLDAGFCGQVACSALMVTAAPLCIRLQLRQILTDSSPTVCSFAHSYCMSCLQSTLCKASWAWPDWR